MDKSHFGWLRIIPLMVALMSGTLALIREYLLFQYPDRAQERPLFWASVRVAFVLSAAIAWWIEHQARRKAESVPPEMDINVLQVVRYPIPFTGVDAPRGDRNRYHIFLNVSVTLCRPQHIRVITTKFVLSRIGTLISAKQHYDLENWEFFGPVTGKSVPAFPNELDQSSFAQGWLHFITEKAAQSDIDENKGILTLVTSHGSIHKDIDMTNYKLPWAQRRDSGVTPKHGRSIGNGAETSIETDAMWLGTDEIWRFKSGHVTHPSIHEFHREGGQHVIGEPIFLWLRCKVCDQFHRGSRVEASGFPVSAMVTRDIECPDKPGSYRYYGQQDWTQGFPATLLVFR